MRYHCPVAFLGLILTSLFLASPALAENGNQSGACSAGLTRCVGIGVNECVNLQTNSSSCGKCGKVCGELEGCTNGVCGCLTGTNKCGGNKCVVAINGCPTAQSCPNPAAEKRCSGQCVNVLRDGKNCGDCNFVCPTGTVCNSGSCACPNSGVYCSGKCVYAADGKCPPPPSACSAGQMMCDGKCVVAVNGKCPAPPPPGAPTCPTGQTYCSNPGQCLKLNTVAHCGSCTNICRSGMDCVSGACVCTTVGLTNCSTYCVNPKTDSSNCGACGNACALLHPCVNGKCQ